MLRLRDCLLCLSPLLENRKQIMRMLRAMSYHMKICYAKETFSTESTKNKQHKTDVETFLQQNLENVSEKVESCKFVWLQKSCSRSEVSIFHFFFSFLDTKNYNELLWKLISIEKLRFILFSISQTLLFIKWKVFNYFCQLWVLKVFLTVFASVPSGVKWKKVLMMLGI